MIFGLLPNWTLDNYRFESADMTDVERFESIAIDGRNLVVYDRSRFERDTVMGGWKRRSKELSRWFVGILVDTQLAGMQFIRSEQKISNYRKFRYATDAYIMVAEGDLELLFQSIENPNTSMYLLRGGTHQTRGLELEIRHRTSVRIPTLVGWCNLEMFAVSPKDCHRHCATVPAFWQSLKTHRILCVPLPSMFVYYYNTFADNALKVGHLLLEKAVREFSVMTFVRFTQAAEYGVVDLFMPAHLQALTAGDLICANEGFLVPLSSKMRASVLERELLRRIGICAVNPVAAIFACARE